MEITKTPYPTILSHINHILNDYSNSVAKIKWIRGHVTNLCSDKVDNLAKLASGIKPQNDFTFHNEEAKSVVELWATSKWTKEWNNGKICQYQNFFELQKTSSFIKATRKAECIYTRLRMMQAKLNGCLFKTGMHIDGKCLHCNIKEDCPHFLLDCPNTDSLRKEIQIKNPLITNWTYAKLLTNTSSANLIIDYVIKNNIQI